mgnify:CR=1 FL=1
MTDQPNNGQATNTKFTATENTPLESLKEAVALLRHPQKGCAWHLRQTMKTLTSYTQSEAYELTDAIDEGDKDEILGELGDLLFHVVTYATHAQEKGWFNLDDVAQAANEKARRRHPWVFEDGSKSYSDTEWESIKAKEKLSKGGQQAEKGLLDGLPKAQPALISAHEIHKRANSVGFKWETVAGLFDKIQEELEEVKEAIYEDHTREHIEEELGDLLFTVAIIGYYKDLNPEVALRLTNEKFKNRFKHIETSMKAANIPLCAENVEHMETYWQEAKGKNRV